jgi:hypothetical protein
LRWQGEDLTGTDMDVVLLEARHAKAASPAMAVKAGRKDAREIAQRLRMGWYSHCTPNAPVHRRRENITGSPPAAHLAGVLNLLSSVF